MQTFDRTLNSTGNHPLKLRTPESSTYAFSVKFKSSSLHTILVQCYLYWFFQSSDLLAQVSFVDMLAMTGNYYDFDSDNFPQFSKAPAKNKPNINLLK